MTDGLVVVDKPAGMTSHDVVGRCRRIFGQRRVGHGGTLDPDATGVLLVGLGRATRLLRWVTGLSKSYVGEVVCGIATSTLDESGTVTGRFGMEGVTDEQAAAAAARLTGSIEQVPPMVSAVQIGGRRLHELARAGVEIDRPARTVTVTRFDIARIPDPHPGPHGGGPVFAATVDCSSGTYVRVLAADLGAALGGGAHLRSLRRTAVGPWTERDAVAIDDLGPGAVRPPLAAVAGLARLDVNAEQAEAVGFGRPFERRELMGDGDEGAGPWAVVGTGGALLAVYEAAGDGRVRPVIVIGTGDG